MGQNDNSYLQLHLLLKEALEAATSAIEGSDSGFAIDVICKNLSEIQKAASHAIPWISSILKLDQIVEYDGLVAQNWHAIAIDWLERLLEFVATATGRELTTPIVEGFPAFQFLPPIFRRSELEKFKIPYRAPKNLYAKLELELSSVQNFVEKPTNTLKRLQIARKYYQLQGKKQERLEVLRPDFENAGIEPTIGNLKSILSYASQKHNIKKSTLQPKCPSEKE